MSASEIISKMYPNALRCGITPERFWRLTLREVADEMTAHTENLKQDRRQQQRFIYDLAILVNKAILGARSFPEFDEFFPDGEQDHSKDWLLIRECIRAQAALYNGGDNP